MAVLRTYGRGKGSWQGQVHLQVLVFLLAASLVILNDGQPYFLLIGRFNKRHNLVRNLKVEFVVEFGREAEQKVENNSTVDSETRYT